MIGRMDNMDEAWRIFERNSKAAEDAVAELEALAASHHNCHVVVDGKQPCGRPGTNEVVVLGHTVWFCDRHYVSDDK